MSGEHIINRIWTVPKPRKGAGKRMYDLPSGPAPSDRARVGTNGEIPPPTIKISESPYQQLQPEYDDIQVGFPDKPGNIHYSIELGGHSTEPISSFRVSPSPQIRRIAPSTTLNIPIYRNPKGFLFRLDSFNWIPYSLQGEQDVRVRLTVASQDVTGSGRIDSSTTLEPFDDPTFTELTRVVSESVVPSNAITSATGLGFPDNAVADNRRAFYIISKEQSIFFIVSNQSAVYTHGFSVSLSGWLYPESIMSDLTRRNLTGAT